MPQHRSVDVHAERPITDAGGLPVTPGYLAEPHVPNETEAVAR